VKKYDDLAAVFGKDNLIPMWVADYRFPYPYFIADAIKKRAEHEVYGYPYDP
jgi:cystathionine beta-lyase